MNYPIQLTERVFVLGNHYLQTYLVVGDMISVLIEPGISSTARLVVDQINSIDIDFSRIRKLLITHAHADHITGAPVLKKEIPGIVVSSSQDTLLLMEKEKVRKLFLKEDADISYGLKALDAGGRPEDAVHPLDGLIHETLQSGQQLALGGVSLEIIDAPGHCLGGLAFWEPQGRILFCSDYLGFFLPPDRFVPNFYVDFDDYTDTFESLHELAPSTLCPGHCGWYQGDHVESFFDLSKKEIEWIWDRVLQDGDSNEKLLKELFHRYFMREATMFSEETTKYCMKLLVKRILDSNREILL